MKVQSIVKSNNSVATFTMKTQSAWGGPAISGHLASMRKVPKSSLMHLCIFSVILLHKYLTLEAVNPEQSCSISCCLHLQSA